MGKPKCSIDIEVDTTQLQNALDLIKEINKELEENNKRMKDFAINLLLMSLDKEKIDKWTKEEKSGVLDFLNKKNIGCKYDIENLKADIL